MRTFNPAVFGYLLETRNEFLAKQPNSAPAITSTGGELTSAFPSCCPVVNANAERSFGSGVLIGDRLVLTADHVAPESCFIRIPAISYTTGVSIEVVKVERDLDADLALLILKQPTAVTPLRLGGAADFDQAKETGVSMCGFGRGRDSFGNLTDGGLKMITPPIPVTVPDSIVGDTNYSPDRECVIGGVTATGVYDAETGDSGSPALLETRTDFVVIAIDSRHADGHKSVFTRVDRNLDWIQRIARANNIPLV